MKFAKTIVYVEDAKASAEFFEKAFGLKGVYHSQGYAEVETGGDTGISFASYAVGQSHLPDKYQVGGPDKVGFEISLVSETVEEDFRRRSRPGRNRSRSRRRSRGGRSRPTSGFPTAPWSTSPRRPDTAERRPGAGRRRGSVHRDPVERRRRVPDVDTHLVTDGRRGHR